MNRIACKESFNLSFTNEAFHFLNTLFFIFMNPHDLRGVSTYTIFKLLKGKGARGEMYWEETLQSVIFSFDD